MPVSELAAVASSLIYEARRGGGGEPRHYPGGHRGAVAMAAEQLRHIATRVEDLCEDAGLERPRQLDFGMADIIHEWAQGESLSRVLYGTEMTGGDFVRNAKRLADVLQQIAVAEPYLGDHAEELADTARLAADQVNRGIVAYSGVD